MVKSDKDCLILFIIQTSEFEKNRGVLEKIQKLIVEYVNDIGLIVLSQIRGYVLGGDWHGSSAYYF